MPITHFACPPQKPTAGEMHEPEHCITKCQHQCYSPFLMAAIVAVNQKNYHKGRYVSATALSGCKRKLNLERTVDYAEYFEQLYAAFRGTITHTVVEEAASVDLGKGKSLADYGFISEWNMIVGFCLREGHGGFPLAPDTDTDDLASYANLSCPRCVAEGLSDNELTIILGGTLDNAEPLWEQFDPETGMLPCKLHDIKTQKEYALKLFIKGDPKNTMHPQVKDDYIAQARIYAYLAERAIPPANLVVKGVKQVKMVESHIQAFSMGEAPWTGGGPYRWRDDYRHPVKDWPMVGIDLGTTEWAENYIRENAQPILDSLIHNRGRAPLCDHEPSSKGSHNFRCDFCAFHGSEFCPNPSLEWKMQVLEGMSPDEAFEYASKHPIELPVVEAAPLDAKDTETIDNFYRKQRGEEPIKIERARKPRAKKEPAEKKPRKTRVKKENAA